MPKMAHIFTEESCMPNRRVPCNVQTLEPYWDHVRTIIGPCFGYFYNIFASGCPKWLNFLLSSHACQIGECWLMPNVVCIFGPCFNEIFACRCLKQIKFSLKCHSCQIEEYSSMFNYLNHIWAMFGPY